jgi:hypothetical protein
MNTVHESLVPDISTVPNIGTATTSYAETLYAGDKILLRAQQQESCVDR